MPIHRRSILAELDSAKQWFLRGLPHQNRLQQARKDGQRSRFLQKEIWAQGCEKADASNVLFEGPLASLSPAAKSPFGAAVPFFFTFFHNLQCCGVLCGGLAGRFAGSNSAKFDPAKDSAK